MVIQVDFDRALVVSSNNIRDKLEIKFPGNFYFFDVKGNVHKCYGVNTISYKSCNNCSFNNKCGFEHVFVGKSLASLVVDRHPADHSVDASLEC